jgi:hypothetical protein
MVLVTSVVSLVLYTLAQALERMGVREPRLTAP